VSAVPPSSSQTESEALKPYDAGSPGAGSALSASRSSALPELTRLLDEQKQIRKLLDEIIDVISVRTAYLRWDTQSLKTVQTLAPRKYEKFVEFFQANSNRKLLDDSIREYVRTIGAGMDGYTEDLPFAPEEQARLRFLEHLQVLDELSYRIESVLADIENYLFADLLEKELEAAKVLKPINLRAAGTLAGVVLERHLRKLALKHSIPIPKPETTLRDLNDPLKLGRVYDFGMWRKIQQLGDLCQLCTHQRNRQPKLAEVEDLISGVQSVIKSVT